MMIHPSIIAPQLRSHCKIFGYLTIFVCSTILSIFVPPSFSTISSTQTAAAQTITQPLPQESHHLWVPLIYHDGNHQSITSPDGKLRLHLAWNSRVDPNDGWSQLHYDVRYRDELIVEPSRLGLTFDASIMPLGPLALVDHAIRSEDEWYTMPFGERRQLHDHYTEMHLQLREKVAPHRLIQLIFRAYNEGIALRYQIPAQPGWEAATITDEQTEFSFTTDHLAYLQWGTEGVYQPTLISAMEGRSENPLTIALSNAQSNGRFVSITEAHVANYPRMTLTRHPTAARTLRVALEGQAQVGLPFQTPWRVLMVAESAAALLQQNDLLYHLSPPPVVADTSWIRPGKAMRIGPLNTAGALDVIDFAADHGIAYVEFDTGWYPHGYGAEFDPTSDATQVVDEIDMAQVIAYGAARDIGLLLYVNEVALRQQLDEILPLYAGWGVKGIKFGFVDGRTQEGINFVHDAVRKAGEYKLLIDIHDNYRPSGMSRTYPHLLTQEGVRGNEHFPGADYNTTLPFTRLLAGAADYTFPYYFDRLNVTRAHQLAAMIVFFSPLQFVFWYDSPVHYGGEVEVELIDALPTVWDETIVVDGSIGEQITVARRHGTAWFVGTLTNSQARTVEIPLTFLPSESTYQIRLYQDQAPKQVAIERDIVTRDSVITAALLPSGGHAMWLVPEGE